jgi:hypothetical protein
MGLVGRLVGFDHGMNARQSAIAATGGVAD